MRAWIAIVPVLAGCLPAVVPRTGDIAPAGDAAVTFALTGQIGRGTVRVRGPDGSVRAHHGNAATAFVGAGDAGPPPELWPDFELQVRVGTGGSCEAGVVLGFLRLGPEVRCGPWQQARGDAASAAVSAAWLWKPGAGSEWRAGLDLSRRAREGADAAIGGVYLSYGDERHAMATGDRSRGWRVPQATVVRKELRLTLPLAVAFTGDAADPSLLVGVVPFWTIHARTKRQRCDDCMPGTQIEGFDARWGGGLVIGPSWP